MTNILSMEVSLDALRDECKAFDFWYNYSDDHRVWSRNYDRKQRIFAMLDKLSHSPEAIAIYNEYAPDQFKRPVESKYYK